MEKSNIPTIVQALSDERNLDTEVIFEAVEDALAAAAKKQNLLDIDARVSVDRETGGFKTYRRWEIVSDDEEIMFPDKQVSLADAKESQSDAAIGEFIEELIPSNALGRISAQTTRQVIMQKVREAERKRVHEQYTPLIGTMLFGSVRRIERADTIVDVDGIEAILPKSLSIVKDGLRKGDRIRGILRDVRSESRGPQLVMDRTCPELLIELFKLEVPETREGLVEIKSAARDPGSRAKIAVFSPDSKIDPIGACVGVRGTRVQSVSNEIAGERVDIVQWSPQAPQFVVNSLAPAVVESIDVDNQTHSMDIVVAESQLSQAIGRSGQNVRLASQLTGWVLNILTHEAAQEKRYAKDRSESEKLMSQLDVDEDVAMILVEKDYRTMLDIAYAETEDLLSIEQFDEKLVGEIQNRATDAMLKDEVAGMLKAEHSKPDQSLLEVEGVDEGLASLLAANDIRTREDLADCSTFDLLDVIPTMDTDVAGQLIMTARAPMLEQLENDGA